MDSGPRSTRELAPESIGLSSQPSSPSPRPPPEQENQFDGWEIIGEQREFYDEQDCLDPSHSLASEKLKIRKEDDVLIFDYSLDPDHLTARDWDPPDVVDDSSLGRFDADDDIFFRVSKNELIESKQFDQIINPDEKSLLVLSRGARLGVIDFPQCYDTYDDSLLEQMGGKLGLGRKGGATFMGAHLQRARALPGHRRFRTGVLLQAAFGGPWERRPLHPSQDRFILFVSFPYFGISSEEITLGRRRESLKLLDFKFLGVDARDRRVHISEEAEVVGIGEILVHQARYMIFDNNTMAAFRSREDCARDQVPLHRFQERVGAFRATIHMIANRTGLELRAFGNLQASLHKVEEGIGQITSVTNICEDDQGMKRRQDTVRALITSLDNLAADLFAAISVVERQIAVLQDLHAVLLSSCGTKCEGYGEGYPLQRNPFHRNIAPIPVLTENPEQIWPRALDTIDEVVRERKGFIKKIKELVENTEIRRKSFLEFWRSENGASAVMEKIHAILAKTADTAKETQNIIGEQTQQTKTLSVFTVVTTAFLPLSFCTSYFGMNNIKEFNDNPLSRGDFWRITGPVCVGITLLAVIIIWGSPRVTRFRRNARHISGGKIADIESSCRIIGPPGSNCQVLSCGHRTCGGNQLNPEMEG